MPAAAVEVVVRPCEARDIEDLLQAGPEFTIQSPVGAIVGFDADSVRPIFLASMGGGDLFKVFVAEVDGKAVGVAGCVSFPAFFNHHKRMTQELFWWVMPKYRGSKAANLLLEAMESWAWGTGSTCMCLIALENRRLQKTSDFYGRHGYAPAEHTFVKENPSWQR